MDREKNSFQQIQGNLLKCRVVKLVQSFSKNCPKELYPWNHKTGCLVSLKAEKANKINSPEVKLPDKENI